MAVNNPPSGKLAVILHADVGGSTALVQQDERRAHERMTVAFRRFSTSIGRYGGIVREIRGDALVAEFARASDAVCAALAFQRTNAESNEAITDDIKPEVRVGIALGEVIIADNTVTGAGVVLAQRVEQLADLGGVCVTEAVREAIPSRLPLESENLGNQAAKGFAKGVHVHKIRLAPNADIPSPDTASSPRSRRRHLVAAAAVALVALVAAAAWLAPWRSATDTDSAQRSVQPMPDKPSLAVLPFENRSRDSDQEYFADGITEDIITDLAKIGDLLVVSSQVAFRYKDKDPEPDTLRETLRVSHVLNGSVRRAGEQLRITAQLTDTANGYQIWAERFDRDLQNVFAIQDEITSKIVVALKVRLTEKEKTLVSRNATVSANAYDDLLRARAAARQWTPEANRQAMRLLRRALETEPDYAKAYAEVSWMHFQAWILSGSTEPEHLDRGLSAAQKAVELAPKLPQAHTILGWIRLWRKEHEEAISAMQHALTINPNYGLGFARLSETLMFAGQPDEALKYIELARSRTTAEYYGYGFWAGEALYYLGRLEAAAREVEASIEQNPQFFASRRFLAAIYAELGELDRAKAQMSKALELNPRISAELLRRQLPFRNPEDLERQLRALEKAGLPA